MAHLHFKSVTIKFYALHQLVQNGRQFWLILFTLSSNKVSCHSFTRQFEYLTLEVVFWNLFQTNHVNPFPHFSQLSPCFFVMFIFQECFKRALKFPFKIQRNFARIFLFIIFKFVDSWFIYSHLPILELKWTILTAFWSVVQ